jgi:PAS domain S-box-containing protein
MEQQAVNSPRTLLRELMGHAARADCLDSVYQSALRCVQHGLGIERASLLLFDATGTMRFVAWSGLSDNYRRAVDGHSPWSPGETNAAPLLVSDATGDPSVAAYLPVFQAEGIRALAFIPLQFGANLLGKFMLYYGEPHVFSAAEIATAEQIADYVVFALEHHRIAVALEEQVISERDLRQRAETEAAQREESESRLHVALAAGQMGAWEWDMTTNRIRWSEELERMHGLEPGTFDGTLERVQQLVHPLDAHMFAKAAAASVEVSQPTDYALEYRIVRPDGACRWLAGRGRLLFDGEGKATRMVGALTDVTEAKRMAEVASESARRKDDFLATLAHELRNPLAAVRMGVSVIRKANGNPATVVENCTVMERQLRHLTRLVDDLLHVADITRGGMPLQRTRIGLAAVVLAAMEQSRDLVDEAGHELSVKLPREAIMLDADSERLVQVLVNLLSNAVKYTPRGGRIEVTAECEGDEMRLSVKDTGFGIPVDKLDSVFEMFGQLDRSRETGHKGLGIGLALARALVSMHGGRITAHSDGPGTGSTFTVWLPLAVAEESAPAMPFEPSADANNGGCCRVMVVDDIQDVAMSLSRWVRQLGHDVRVAFDGVAAIQMAEEFRPAVILLDIGMPNMNGYEVARALRATPWGSQMKLVAVTGWGQEDDQRRSADAGFDRHMTKPLDPTVLETYLESIARSHAVAPRESSARISGETAQVMSPT